MNQNHVSESSSVLGPAGLNVVFEDESEYVFVDGELQGINEEDLLLLDDEWDDES